VKNSVNVVLRIQKTLLKEAKEAAHAQGLSLSHVMRTLLAAFVTKAKPARTRGGKT